MNSGLSNREQSANDALTEARDALAGFAATYRDSHAGQVLVTFPCPDTDNDGIADPPCGATDVSAIGRLPWKTLGIRRCAAVRRSVLLVRRIRAGEGRPENGRTQQGHPWPVRPFRMPRAMTYSDRRPTHAPWPSFFRHARL